MGSLYAELGDIDRAMEWFQKGIEERAPTMIYMKVAPQWDAVRSDARFQAMLRQSGGGSLLSTVAWAASTRGAEPLVTYRISARIEAS